jgi:hypothetical protein
MHVHHAIAALRADPVLQRRRDAAMSRALTDWLRREPVDLLEDCIARFAAGADLASQRELAMLMRDHRAAKTFVDGFLTAFIAALRQETLGEVPFRHSSSAGYSRLLLMQRAGVSLTLCAYEPLKCAREPELVQFADCERHEILLNGRVRGVFHRRLRNDQVVSEAREWGQGDTIHCQPRCESRQFIEVGHSVLLLQLTRAPAHPEPTLVYRLTDSALIQQSSGDKRASEHVMALGVLGALGHKEAIAPMCAFATDLVRDMDARWEAVRQVLALDSGHGLTLLADLSQRSDDPLALPAGKLRQDLLKSYPALSQPQKEPA